MFKKALIILILAAIVFAAASSGTNNPGLSSPRDRIAPGQIEVYGDRVIIYLDDPEWAGFTDTGSMEPVLGANANAIELKPGSPDEIEPGDIISYKSNFSELPIIHRVVRTGTDEKGWYAIVKGDNNASEDPERVRFEQVQRVVVAIIY